MQADVSVGVCNGPLQRFEYVVRPGTGGFFMRAVNENGVAEVSQHFRQQRRQQHGFSGTVVGGQQNGGLVARQTRHQVKGCVIETRQFVGSFTFDSHGEAKRTYFKIGDSLSQDSSKKVSGLLSGQIARAFAATTNLFEICTNAHVLPSFA